MANIATINNGEICVRDPFGDGYIPASSVQSLISSTAERVKMRQQEVQDVGDEISSIKQLAADIKADDDLLRAYEGDLKDALLNVSGFKAFVVQNKGTGSRIDPMSNRGKLRALADFLDAKIKANEPPEPVHTYVVKVNCTDRALSKILKFASANGSDVYAVTPQSDSAIKSIAKWFEANR